MTRTLKARKDWFLWLHEHSIGVSGGSLSGMRRSVWGKDAYVVRCCKHLFRVDEDVFQYIFSKT